MRSSLQQTSTLWVLAKNGTNALDYASSLATVVHINGAKTRDWERIEMPARWICGVAFCVVGWKCIHVTGHGWSWRGVIEIGCWAFHWCFFDVFGMTMGVLHWSCGSGKWYVIDMRVLIGFCVKHKERRFSNNIVNIVFLVSLITRT